MFRVTNIIDICNIVSFESSCQMSLVAVNAVTMLHFILILFVVIVPFKKNNSFPLDLLHFATTGSILLHWYLNNNACFLTIVESSLRGVEHTKTFVHSLVAPVYDFPEHDMAIFVHSFTILVFLMSSQKVYKRLNKYYQTRSLDLLLQ